MYDGAVKGVFGKSISFVIARDANVTWYPGEGDRSILSFVLINERKYVGGKTYVIGEIPFL